MVLQGVKSTILITFHANALLTNVPTQGRRIQKSPNSCGCLHNNPLSKDPIDLIFI